MMQKTMPMAMHRSPQAFVEIIFTDRKAERQSRERQEGREKGEESRVPHGTTPGRKVGTFPFDGT